MIALRGRQLGRTAYISPISHTFSFGRHHHARPWLSPNHTTTTTRTATTTTTTPGFSIPPRSLLSFANMSTFASFRVPTVTNEPNHTFAKGSAQRDGLWAAIQSVKKRGTLDVPLLIGGREVMTSSTGQQLCPADHKTVVARYAKADAQAVDSAIAAAMAAKPAWEALPFADRAAIFLKAADLIATKYRYDVLAATMVGQGKNAWQAEIDAAAELIDFLRFNVQYAAEIYANQPMLNSPGVWNRLEYRPLEGFVYAITPFNFTAIGGNLVAAPALMGNVVVWKPSDYAISSNYLLLQILLEAGLPRDVVQFVPGDPVTVTRQVLAHRDFAALHYTGSTAVFRSLFGQVGVGVAEGRYLSYPRMVGETGGKNFHLLHPSADVENAVVQTVRGAFEYSGQKCSATSRMYVPASLWPQVRKRLAEETERLTMGDNTEWATFIGPVIHQAAFERIAGAIDAAKRDPELELVAGGTHDGSRGYFVQPTIFEAKNPRHALLSTELFGPVLTVYVWDDSGSAEAFADVCALVDGQSEYGLTGSVFATDRTALRLAEEALRHASGMFYINCKSTGARVHEQPFGGARASGTNAKAGMRDHLLHFVSTRTIKEEFLPTTVVGYPSNE